MKQADFVQKLCEVGKKWRKTEVADFLKTLGHTVNVLFASGTQEITLSGIGKLKLVQRRLRKCYNPKTKGTITIPAHHTLKLVVSKRMKETLN